ncbi:HD-GYP domain-containing protein [Desulfuribacillus alkaliarsenatis]|uniref:HD-GYP domain-containing protein n=1 Tax=Desulfuribacillus alkaliarsenatis TaxID=766136 RepID=A0A1E5G5C9_9FIRM|nr:HD-GYP domain-containing protein [Desulfuribacillus alkaliarsenatis]OEF98392.1 hypothetical protein BHF68_01565 [Desulfuribacillus alkaliarsenatis]
MRLIALQNLEAHKEHTLAKNILAENGQILLRAGTKLTAKLILRLQIRRIPYVYIDDPLTEGINPIDVVSEETRRKALEKTSTIINNLMKKKRDKIIGRDEFNIKKEVEAIITDVQRHPGSMYNMVNMQSMDDYLFHHSVNVGIISVILGVGLKYSKDKLIELGIGATLHDVGKTLIPIEILNKPGILNELEYDLMKEHSMLGFEILKEQPGIPLISAHVALQHHERWNGSGYPRGLAKLEQHEYARITAIADVYDALTSTRSYRKAYLPHEAVELLFGAGNHHFDYELVKMFRDKIAIYPIGMSVLLNDGRIAVVSEENKISPQRPKVRVIMNNDKTPVTESYEIDLYTDPKVMISEVI